MLPILLDLIVLTILMRELKRRLIQQEPQELHGALVSLLIPMVRHDLYETREVQAVLGDLDQHVNCICKFLK